MTILMKSDTMEDARLWRTFRIMRAEYEFSNGDLDGKLPADDAHASAAAESSERNGAYAEEE